MAFSVRHPEVIPDVTLSREELIEQGVSPREANVLAVRSSLMLALEIAFERWGRMWMCSVILLILGMVGVLIWSEMVYDSHRTDACDQPLAQLLQALYIIVAIHTFQREIIRHVLCYSFATEGPMEPPRVLLFRRLSLAAVLVWPVAGVWMLSRTHRCSSDLMSAVRVITCYYTVVAFVAVVLPACFISVMLILVTRGLVRAPRSRNAAPDGLVDGLEKLAYDAAIFDDERPGGYPTACPICLDNFDKEQAISKTPCPAGCHAFHTECLRGWLQCARTCPLCRQDLMHPGAGDPEAGIEIT